MERTFYKLTIVALAIIVVVQAFTMAANIYSYLEMSRYGAGVGIIDSFVFFGALTARFALYVCALFWVPKIIKKLFSEVA